MNNEYTSKVNDINSKIIIHRTFIEIINSDKQIKIGFFDMMACYIQANKLIIKTKYLDDILIIGNNKQLILNKISVNITNLKYDVKTSDLIINTNEDFTCAICLEENKKNNDIIKLKCCENLLHHKCFLDYLKNNILYKCPLCRNKECPLCLGNGC